MAPGQFPLLFRELRYWKRFRQIYGTGIQFRWQCLISSNENAPEIVAFISGEADKRMLFPLITELLRKKAKGEYSGRITIILFTQITPAQRQSLHEGGCHIEDFSYVALLRACRFPAEKIGLLCLDHRFHGAHHKLGVHVAEILNQFDVKTVSIQHGGTREDSIAGIASTASQFMLVWGNLVYRRLVDDFKIDPERIRIVGNPLHDRLAMMEPGSVRQLVSDAYQSLFSRASQRKIILLATCLRAEYAGRPDEAMLYQKYIEAIYAAIDYEQAILVVKLHPQDSTENNLYRRYLPNFLTENHDVFIIEHHQSLLDFYQLLLVADLLITRASTVAEEALLLHKPVIAYDIDEQGPSSYYQHLECYELYQRVLSTPKERLAQAISLVLSSYPSDWSHDLTSEFTFALDGQSTQRAVRALLSA
ncbi:MAG: UDP-N-acetylglucosamine 2-epimerase [Cyanobacteria bacterium P01_H01_bin.15]